MLPLIASIALLQAQDEPPRLRTILENNAVVLVEPVPTSNVISVQLFASSKYVPETDETHGYRHLIEHLAVRGDGSYDRKLESQGCFMLAETLRDAMQIEVTVGPNQLELALSTLKDILHEPTFTQQGIDHELKIMRNEMSMQDDALLLASAAWSAAYGEGGLDPLGTFDSMYRATPEKLADTYERQFASDGLVLSIAGPVDLDKATSLAKAALGPLPKTHFEAPPVVRDGKSGRIDAAGFGECRAALVPGFDKPQTAAALAAALAVASEMPHCFVIYTPSVRPGLVLVGRTTSNNGLGLYVDGLESGAALFARGKLLAHEWVARQLRSAHGIAYLRGLLICQGDANRPESMLKQIDALTPAQFDDGIKALQSGRAVIAVGTR